MTFGFSPDEIWESAGPCTDGQTGLPIQTVVQAIAAKELGTGSVTSVTATWNNGTQSVALTFGGNDAWTGLIGPYAAATVDLVLVQATDDSGNVSSAIEALTVNACPA